LTKAVVTIRLTNYSILFVICLLRVLERLDFTTYQCLVISYRGLTPGSLTVSYKHTGFQVTRSETPFPME